MNKTIGERINYYRNMRGFTQKELGLKCGFKESTADVQVRYYESGKRVPCKDIILKLATALSINPLCLQLGYLSDYFYEEILDELIDDEGEYHNGDILKVINPPSMYGNFIVYIEEKGKTRVNVLTRNGVQTIPKTKLKDYKKAGYLNFGA